MQHPSLAAAWSLLFCRHLCVFSGFNGVPSIIMRCAAGAVKITPAHDPNDFLVGKRHSLEFINILDDNGNINDNGGSFKGQPRFQVRGCGACSPAYTHTCAGTLQINLLQHHVVW
jgi:hypothetical protein